jgi:hypothetical protein
MAALGCTGLMKTDEGNGSIILARADVTGVPARRQGRPAYLSARRTRQKRFPPCPVNLYIEPRKMENRAWQ